MSYSSTAAALIANSAGAITTWESEFALYSEAEQRKSLALVMRLAAPASLTATQRATNIDVYDINGTTLHAASNGILNAWTAPAAAMITRVILDITTVATGACTLDVGYHVTTLTTSDTLLDGVDANAAVAVFDSMNAALDSGSNAKAQKAASGGFITIDEKTGDSTGLVGKLYIHYFYI